MIRGLWNQSFPRSRDGVGDGVPLRSWILLDQLVRPAKSVTMLPVLARTRYQEIAERLQLQCCAGNQRTSPHRRCPRSVCSGLLASSGKYRAALLASLRSVTLILIWRP
jgi:hypothetical protein